MGNPNSLATWKTLNLLCFHSPNTTKVVHRSTGNVQGHHFRRTSLSLFPVVSAKIPFYCWMCDCWWASKYLLTHQPPFAIIVADNLSITFPGHFRKQCLSLGEHCSQTLAEAGNRLAPALKSEWFQTFGRVRNQSCANVAYFAGMFPCAVRCRRS